MSHRSTRINTGRAGHGATRFNTGRAGHGSTRFNTGRAGHGATGINTGRAGHGATRFNTGRAGHGATRINTGRAGHGATRFNTGRAGHGATRFNTGRTGHSSTRFNTGWPRFLPVLTVVLCLSAVASPCAAQAFHGRETPHRGSIELSGGGVYQGGTDLPDQTATLTRNPTTGPAPFELFTSDSSLRQGFGVQARLGFYLSSAISVEAGVQLARPRLEARLADDFEGAADTVATESISSYLFTGSLLYHVDTGKAFKPFVMGGAGHVRDLHAGHEVVETGLEYHAGGGIKCWFRKGRRKLGLRLEAIVSFRDGGVGADEKRRVVPTGAVSLAYLF